MSPFRNILKLSVGDFLAKAAYFLAFVYMARKLGVGGYGVLEFAIAVRTYLLLLADAGLELWSVREAAKGVDVTILAARIIPARLMLAAVALFAAWLVGAAYGDASLRQILLLLTLTVFVQAFNLKWVFMGQEQMARVAIGLIASQLVFAGCILILVRRPSDLILVPAAFLASELVITAYFWRLFVRRYGAPRIAPDWRGLRSMVSPVLTLGASQCLGLMSYNVDSILIGVMLGAGPVGWYAAAYKPVTAVLAAPITYYQGLFPALSRTYKEDREKFRAILLRSLRFTAVFAVPLGIGGTLLAEPIVRMLFGPSYLPSVPALQLLSWSAVLVTMRGNFRHTLNAAGKQRTDLACAGAAAALNVAFNLALIPRYGITGAAAATVLSEIAWFALARHLFAREVMALPLFPVVWRPALAGTGMAACLILGGGASWIVRAAVSLAVYVLILVGAGEPELKSVLARWRAVGVDGSAKAVANAAGSALLPKGRA
jgi:O-antigen/teichoic acid export membrane protein